MNKPQKNNVSNNNFIYNIKIKKKICFQKVFNDTINVFLVLSIEPNAIIFNKTGNDIIGTITLKNISTEKPLSYKV